MRSVSGKRSPQWAFMESMTIPCENGEDYLTRLRIVQTPWFGIYLHNLDAPDSDPYVHNHPWDFVSIILRGRYLEYVDPLPYVFPGNPHFTYRRMWQQFSWHKMTTDKAHRIISVEPGTMSLIITGPRRKSWGFFTPDGYVDWKDHEAAKGMR